MKRFSFIFCWISALLCPIVETSAQQPVHLDRPFEQEHSVKYHWNQSGKALVAAAADRNGKIQVVSNAGLFHPHAGQFLFPGELIADNSYRFMKDKAIQNVTRYKDQLVFLSDKLVFSNSWAGELYTEHGLKGASLFAGGKDFHFLVSDGKSLHFVNKSKVLWKGSLKADEAIEIRYQENADAFWVLGKNT